MSDKHYEVESQHNLDNSKLQNESNGGLSLVDMLKNSSPESKNNLPRLADKNENASPTQLEFPNLESLMKQIKNAIDKTPNNTQTPQSLKSILDQIKDGSGIQKEGDKAWKQHQDLINELLGEKQKPLDDEKIRDYAKSIAAIISKDNDFSYGGKNEKIQNMFGEAAKAGDESFKKLLAQVNSELAERGIKIKGGFEMVDKVDVVDYGGTVLTVDPPIFPNATVRRTKTAQVELSLNSKSGGEDSLKFSKTISDVTSKERYREPLSSKHIKELH